MDAPQSSFCPFLDGPLSILEQPAVARSCDDVQPALDDLAQVFRQEFALLDLRTEQLVCPDNWLPIDMTLRIGLCREVARRGQAEIIEDFLPLVVLAIPLPAHGDEISSQVAVATFLTEHPTDIVALRAAAAAVGVKDEEVQRWSLAQVVWPPHGVQQLGQEVLGRWERDQQSRALRRQFSNVSRQLVQTYEELTLLHQLTERLSLSSSETELAERAIDWLQKVLPAECLAVGLRTATEAKESPDQRCNWSVAGKSPLPTKHFDAFLGSLGPDAERECVQLNQGETSDACWPYPQVREVLSMPIQGTSKIIGWLIALNCHSTEWREQPGEFGTLETSLLSSVATILGMHAGNLQLYQEQEEFFESTIRAFSSSIDAKDPYTRGHSDRVAQVSVCLARQLGVSPEDLNTIYLSALLHDIGKIGIDDHVLRKPGSLTDAEYKHIQQHPELGYRILKGIRKLEHVLPVVLHHHESWDGTGYPARLQGEEIPWFARIVAVADAFDAMSNDRHYRKGMSREQVDGIFRDLAGKQWDPTVVAAFFAVRDDIEAVLTQERNDLSLDVRRWNV